MTRTQFPSKTVPDLKHKLFSYGNIVHNCINILSMPYIYSPIDIIQFEKHAMFTSELSCPVLRKQFPLCGKPPYIHLHVLSYDGE